MRPTYWGNLPPAVLRGAPSHSRRCLDPSAERGAALGRMQLATCFYDSSSSWPSPLVGSTPMPSQAASLGNACASERDSLPFESCEAGKRAGGAGNGD